MERREWFKIIAASALTEAAVRAAQPPFFDAAQTAMLERLSDIVIPSDEQSPGALDAGVARFLDLLAAHSSSERQQEWRRGIEAVEAASRQRYSRAFADCTRDQQEQLVSLMAAHEGEPGNELERFFEIFKPAVVDGYRFSEIGVMRYMRWTGNHGETAAWTGACHHPEHGAKS